MSYCYLEGDGLYLELRFKVCMYHFSQMLLCSGAKIPDLIQHLINFQIGRSKTFIFQKQYLGFCLFKATRHLHIYSKIFTSHIPKTFIRLSLYQNTLLLYLIFISIDPVSLTFSFNDNNLPATSQLRVITQCW